MRLPFVFCLVETVSRETIVVSSFLLSLALSFQEDPNQTPSLPALQRSIINRLRPFYLRFRPCSGLYTSASDPAAVYIPPLPTLERSIYLRFLPCSGLYTSASYPAALYI